MNFFAGMLAIAMFFAMGCSELDPSNPEPKIPIEELVLPISSATDPISKGTVVTIRGRGFTKSDVLALDCAGSRHQVVVELISTGISFIAPAIEGQASMILLRDQTEYNLGTIFFSTGNLPIAERLYSYSSSLSRFCTLDFETGAVVSVECDCGELYDEVTPVYVSEVKKIYYVTATYSDDEQETGSYKLRIFDPKAQTAVATGLVWDDRIVGSLGAYNGSLHRLLYDGTSFTLSSISDTGEVAEKCKINFTFGNDALFKGNYQMRGFVCDEQENLLMVDIYQVFIGNPVDEEHQYVVLIDLQQETVKTLELRTDLDSRGCYFAEGAFYLLVDDGDRTQRRCSLFAMGTKPLKIEDSATISYAARIEHLAWSREKKLFFGVGNDDATNAGNYRDWFTLCSMDPIQGVTKTIAQPEGEDLLPYIFVAEI